MGKTIRLKKFLGCVSAQSLTTRTRDFRTLRSNIFAKTKKFAKPFLPVHMGPIPILSFCLVQTNLFSGSNSLLKAWNTKTLVIQELFHFSITNVFFFFFSNYLPFEIFISGWNILRTTNNFPVCLHPSSPLPPLSPPPPSSSSQSNLVY